MSAPKRGWVLIAVGDGDGFITSSFNTDEDELDAVMDAATSLGWRIANKKDTEAGR